MSFETALKNVTPSWIGCKKRVVKKCSVQGLWSFNVTTFLECSLTTCPLFTIKIRHQFAFYSFAFFFPIDAWPSTTMLIRDRQVLQIC